MTTFTRRALTRAAGGAVALLALAAPIASAAGQVPAAGTMPAKLVGAAAPAAGAAVRSVPLRVQNPAQYASQKAAANAAYRSWVAAHPALFGPALTISTSIPMLSKPGFTASQSGGSTPPDTTGAIGPNYYLEFVNSRIGVYNRNTLASPPVAQVSEDTFVASTSTCDGQIKWDQAAQRWLYYSLDCAAPTSGQGFSFGFSKTASPTPLPSSTSAGNWCRYHVGTGSTLEDYGKLGQSNSFLVIGANEFDMTTGSYLDSSIITFPKPANGTKVSTCPSEAGTEFTSGVGFTPEPANVFGSSANGFVVALQDTSHLVQYTVSGTTSPTLTNNGPITVPAFSTPAGVPQPGSTDLLDSSDTRLTQAVAAFDPALKVIGVWTQHTVAGAQGGPSVVRWYELRAGVAQSAPVQTGTVAVSGAFAFNGAISPTAQGNAAAIDYNVGSSTSKVQVRARDRLPGATAGSMGNETVLASSAGVNADFSCPSQGSGSASCRWGDYAGASPDPTCRGQVYGTNELNGATSPGSSTWTTQDFRLTVRTCPTAAFTWTPASPVHGSAVTFDGSGSTTPNGSITKYGWNFGDGTTSTVTTATDPHTYGAAGTYSVTLTVTDSAGLTGSVVHKVTVS